MRRKLRSTHVYARKKCAFSRVLGHDSGYKIMERCKLRRNTRSLYTFTPVIYSIQRENERELQYLMFKENLIIPNCRVFIKKLSE